MRRKAVGASDETSNKVLGSEHPPTLIRVQADGRGGKAFCASNSDIQYSTWAWAPRHPDQQSQPGIYLIESTMDRGRKAGRASGGDIHPITLIFSAGQLAKRVAIPTFFFGRRIWAGGQAEQKKKRRGITMAMREKAFWRFWSWFLFFWWQHFPAVTSISLYVHRLATCLLRY